jgi:hypothetical protein
MDKLDLIGIKNIDIELPKLNILDILGLQRDENLYSDVLFYLFKSEVGNKFITIILESLKINYPKKVKDAKIEVFREYHRRDITIIFTGLKYFIGIENKIDAGEREKQIGDYQGILEKYYSDYSGHYLFLTPDGRESSTDNKKSKYKCYSISYKVLLKSLYLIKDTESIKNCTNTFIDCIEENIVMNDKSVDKVYQIWGNKSNRDKLKVLLQNRPTIMSIKDKLYDKIDKYLSQNGDGIDYDKCFDYPPTSPKELHLRVKSLNQTNIPITFLFYDYDNIENTPSLRIALHYTEFKSMPKNRIKSYKEKYDFLAFEKIRYWGGPWYALYTGKSIKADFIVTEDHDYGDKLINILFKRFKKEYEKIKELI